MPETAIYHPWIDPPNKSTLVTAMLYWDRVETIVPESIGNPYRMPHSRAAMDLGFLKPRFVHSQLPEVESAGRSFAEMFEDPAVQADGRAIRADAGNEEPVPEWLHGDKVSDLMKRFVLRGCAAKWGDWYNIVEGFGAAYMSHLAAVLANQHDLHPLTDRGQSHNVSSASIAQTVPINAPSDAEAMLVTATIDLIRLQPSVELSRVWAFKEQHYDELARYRSAIRNLARQLAWISEPDRLEAAVQQVVVDEVQPSLEQVQGHLRDGNIDFTLGALETTLIGGIPLLLGGFEQWPAALAGVGVGVVFGLCRRRLAAFREERNGPYAYLMHAQQRFPAAEDCLWTC